MQLSKIIDKTKEYYNIPSKSLFHNTISLVISQKIAFGKGRAIRIKIYDKIGSYEMSYDNMKDFTKEDLASFGLESFQIETIQRVMALPQPLVYNDVINKVKGIGEWTKKALELYEGNKDNILLVEDYWIRKRVRDLFDLSKIPTVKEAEKLLDGICKNKSNVSKFLWRIKPEAIKKIRGNMCSDKCNSIALDKNDFI